MNKYKIIRALILSMLLPIFVHAQDEENLTLIIYPIDTFAINLYAKTEREHLIPDSSFVPVKLQEVLDELYALGFLAASFDSVIYEAHTVKAYLFAGRQYTIEDLSIPHRHQEILNEVRYRDKNYSGEIFTGKNMDRLKERIVRYLENNGYPFASVSLDSVVIDGEKISSLLQIDRGNLILFDTLAVTGDAKISRRYLYSYLGFKPGQRYDESVVKKIDQRLHDLPFVAIQKPFRVIFSEDKALITLFLAERKTSQVDILIGVLPNSEITGRLLITGEANLNLVNPFGTGKTIELNYKKLEHTSQDLYVRFNYPYVLSTPFGIDLRFELYKKDTLYLDLEREVGVEYLFAGGNYIKAFFNNVKSTVLTVDTATVIATRELPDIIDMSTSLFGIEYKFSNLDYRYNPRRGFSVLVSGAMGVKKILENNTIIQLRDFQNPELTLGHLYDSVELRTTQMRFSYRIDKYWPFLKRGAIKTGLQGAALVSDNLFRNELFRIGGTKTLRGFDEEAILASLYNVLTVELRYLLSRNSYAYIFGDAAYTEDRSRGQFGSDWPYGFGVGLSFETGAGVFGVSYALGSQKQNPVSFKSAKIHFGYVNYF